MEPFELRSDTVVLSVPTDGDIDRITAICQDPEIQEWTTVPSPYSRAHAETFVKILVAEGWRNVTSLTWALRGPSDPQVMGMIGVSLTDDGKGEIGYWLAREGRGRGMMSAAIRMVARRVFTDPRLRLTHLIWWAYTGNWASRRAAWATGFRHEGTVRGGQPQRGRRRDAWVASLAAGDPMTPATRWLEIPVIHGERVTLRPPAETDADALVEACSDPTSQWWLSILPSPYTRSDALEYIRDAPESAAAGQAVAWAIAPAGDGAAIGSCSLRLIGARRDQGVLGYLVHPAARGAGVATEAARLMVRHAFIPAGDGGLGLRRLVIEHPAGNDASRSVIRRLGFRHCGVDRAAVELPDGTFADHHRYDLLAHEFTSADGLPVPEPARGRRDR